MNGTIDESESFAFYTPSLFALYQPCFAGRDYQLCLSLAVYGQVERPAAQPDKIGTHPATLLICWSKV